MWRALPIALLVLVLPSFGTAGVPGSDGDPFVLQAKLAPIVRASRGTVGIGVIHLETGTHFSINGDRRFPMASVVKLPIAVELLSQVAEGRLTIDRPIWIGPNQIRACCTLSRKHPRGGITLTAGELLELMIAESDNTASDVILELVGGPAVVERRMRALGFNAINVNRYGGEVMFDMVGVLNAPPREQWTLEMEHRLISEVPPDVVQAARARYTADPRDTATPNEMARFLGRLQLGNLLPRRYTDLLLDLMAHSKTGSNRIRGRLPSDTPVAHKTGTMDVAVNDVGIIRLPDGGGHLVLAVFVTNGGRPSAMQYTIAQTAAAAFEVFTGKPLPKVVKAKAKPAKPPKVVKAKATLKKTQKPKVVRASMKAPRASSSPARRRMRSQ